MLGCCLGIPASITAITFVALGTSLPDTLASRSAALHDDYADDSVGNITGSNSVNVFLGIGLPWVIGSIYWQAQCGIAMPVPAGDLGFSVVIFLCTAVVCIAVLAVRRQTLGYELGGKYRLVSGSILVSLWGLYIRAPRRANAARTLSSHDAPYRIAMLNAHSPPVRATWRSLLYLAVDRRDLCAGRTRTEGLTRGQP
jgi:hypothetical protein